jgi:hypothetical protein
MKANPDKFQALAIGKKSMDKIIVLDLAGYKIKCEKEVKLLGVTIDFELKFNSHISNISMVIVLRLLTFNVGSLENIIFIIMYYYNHYK